jgi:hypothetical protein
MYKASSNSFGNKHPAALSLTPIQGLTVPRCNVAFLISDCKIIILACNLLSAIIFQSPFNCFILCWMTKRIGDFVNVPLAILLTFPFVSSTVAFIFFDIIGGNEFHDEVPERIAGKWIAQFFARMSQAAYVFGKPYFTKTHLLHLKINL